MGSLKIDMLGTSFSIRVDEDEEYMKKLLGYYRQITDQIAANGSLEPRQVAILAGIMICDELYKEKSKKAVEKNIEQKKQQKRAKEQEERDEKIEAMTAEMIKKLDSLLEG